MVARSLLDTISSGTKLPDAEIAVAKSGIPEPPRQSSYRNIVQGIPMVRSPLPLLLLAACLIAIPFIGCSTMESLNSSSAKPTHEAKSKSKTQETDDDDADEESDSSWKNIDDSRDALAREEALDQWYGKFDYADKGRAIERGLR